jgi:RimJ/RimL family protein N-acetyltransferase
MVGELGIEVASYGVADFGMMVAADARGRGAGSALLSAAIDWAREAGVHKIALQAWPHNEPAIALYRKFGFEQEGYLRRHYRRRNGDLWDAVVMGLPLDN